MSDRIMCIKGSDPLVSDIQQYLRDAFILGGRFFMETDLRIDDWSGLVWVCQDCENKIRIKKEFDKLEDDLIDIIKNHITNKPDQEKKISEKELNESKKKRLHKKSVKSHDVVEGGKIGVKVKENE